MLGVDAEWRRRGRDAGPVCNCVGLTLRDKMQAVQMEAPPGWSSCGQLVCPVHVSPHGAMYLLGYMQRSMGSLIPGSLRVDVTALGLGPFLGSYNYYFRGVSAILID